MSLLPARLPIPALAAVNTPLRGHLCATADHPACSTLHARNRACASSGRLS
jgi:hypothetical protein